ncbi:MAG: sulfite exporter TauE/SafE family protein [Luteolibacter sp.]
MLADPSIYAVALLAAFLIGMSKAGFSGISLISVFLFADIYGAKASVGLALPLLIAADLMALPAFLKYGSWKPVWKLLGPALVGLGIAWWMLGTMSDASARKWIGGCILLMVVLQAARKVVPRMAERVSGSPTFGMMAGVMGGFATMLANAAGPVIQLYLAAREIPKMELIGIGARFFLVINLLKLPLNSSLALITPASLWENVLLLPGVICGILFGKWLIHHVSQRAFEWMIVVFALVAGVRLVVG